MLQASLGIKDHCGIEINDKSLKFIVDYLKQLDVLYPIPEVNGFDSGNKYIFTQIGMRYSQATQQIKALSSNFDVAYLEKLEGEVCGKILEDIILGQLLRENSSNSEASSKRDISRYRSDELQGAEIDIVISDKKIKRVLVIEVKRSDKRADKQRRYLNRDDVCLDIERKTGNTIANKVVVYRGENGEEEDGVLYLNANYFLIQSQEMIEALLNNPQIKTFPQLESLVKKGSVGSSEQKALLGKNWILFLNLNESII